MSPKPPVLRNSFFEQRTLSLTFSLCFTGQLQRGSGHRTSGPPDARRDHHHLHHLLCSGGQQTASQRLREVGECPRGALRQALPSQQEAGAPGGGHLQVGGQWRFQVGGQWRFQVGGRWRFQVGG